MKKHLELMRSNHFVYFWMGVLTGAIVVGLLFFYRLMSPGDYQSSTFGRLDKYDFGRYTLTTDEGVYKGVTTSPYIGDPDGYMIDPTAIGDPDGY